MHRTWAHRTDFIVHAQLRMHCTWSKDNIQSPFLSVVLPLDSRRCSRAPGSQAAAKGGAETSLSRNLSSTAEDNDTLALIWAAWHVDHRKIDLEWHEMAGHGESNAHFHILPTALSGAAWAVGLNSNNLKTLLGWCKFSEGSLLTRRVNNYMLLSAPKELLTHVLCSTGISISDLDLL